METILVVDDEKNYLVVLETLLSGEGYQVLTASAGEEALRVLGEDEADLVITDMKMPGLDGVALLASIKEQQRDLP
ncbi:MAG: response regulator, partial [Deltaproteobacteria bacterium]|nr:response regulator [Deltaproteobacteria bacterium]